ncbi:subtilase [Colletotrichum somersetense]|nr:subtilase [Colletotrichum somersetense]
MVGIRYFTVLAVAVCGLIAPTSQHTYGNLTVQAVADSYIITLKDGVDDNRRNFHLSWVNKVHSNTSDKSKFTGVSQNYSYGAFRGYAGKFDQATIKAIKDSPEVSSVEPDQICSLNAVATQPSAAWGLGAISHRTPGFTQYVYNDAAGSGTFAYVIDSGINTGHVELSSRTLLGDNFAGGDHIDTLGHGTHVAGIIGSTTYGVAKLTSLVSVKVFSGSSASMSVVLAGYAWAVNDIISKGRAEKSVINMSLGGSASTAWASAIRAAYRAGITTVVAAGNEAQNATNSSPANVAEAITVGAIDNAWTIASYSNFGVAVDVFAPGTYILSTWIDSNTSSIVLSGTSMAAPHVAGLVNYIQSTENVKKPSAVIARIKSLSTPNKINGNLNGSPNLMAYNGVIR